MECSKPYYDSTLKLTSELKSLAKTPSCILPINGGSQYQIFYVEVNKLIIKALSVAFIGEVGIDNWVKSVQQGVVRLSQTKIPGQKGGAKLMATSVACLQAFMQAVTAAKSAHDNQDVEDPEVSPLMNRAVYQASVTLFAQLNLYGLKEAFNYCDMQKQQLAAGAATTAT